jgi:hypothetical protein
MRFQNVKTLIKLLLESYAPSYYKYFIKSSFFTQFKNFRISTIYTDIKVYLAIRKLRALLKNNPNPDERSIEIKQLINKQINFLKDHNFELVGFDDISLEIVFLLIEQAIKDSDLAEEEKKIKKGKTK